MFDIYSYFFQKSDNVLSFIHLVFSHWHYTKVSFIPQLIFVFLFMKTLISVYQYESFFEKLQRKHPNTYLFLVYLPCVLGIGYFTFLFHHYL